MSIRLRHVDTNQIQTQTTTVPISCSELPPVLNLAELRRSRKLTRGMIEELTWRCRYVRLTAGANKLIAVYVHRDILRNLLYSTRCVLCSQRINSNTFSMTPPDFLKLIDVSYSDMRARLAHVTLHILSVYSTYNNRQRRFFFSREICNMPCDEPLDVFKYLRNIYSKL